MKRLSISIKGKKGTEVNMLFPFVLLIVLVGMIIGVGIITLDKFGSTVYYKGTDLNQSVVSTAINNISHVSLTIGNVSNFVVINSIGVYPSACYQLNATQGTWQYINNTENACGTVNTTLYFVYDYKDYATETRDATASVSSEIGGIATDWISLIVTVFVLSIILFFVVRTFNPAIGR